MGNSIFNKNINDFQLISIGIELTHKVLSIQECMPKLISSNPHIAKSYELAVKWNELFIKAYISKEGEV